LNSLLFAAAVVVLFSLLLERLHVEARARDIVCEAERTLALLRDADIDDEMKAGRLRRHSLRLAVLAAVVTFQGTLSLLLPLAGVWALDRGGLVSFGAVVDVLERWDFLVAAAAIGTGVFLLVRRTSRE
jgi:hypothetical protein